MKNSFFLKFLPDDNVTIPWHKIIRVGGKGRKIASLTLPCGFPRLFSSNTIKCASRKHIRLSATCFFYRRSSFTLRRFPTQVHVRRSNVIPIGHSIRGHLQKQVLGSRTFTGCLQGLLLHVHRHDFSSNWKRFVHMGSTFVESHTHWHLTGSHRKLKGQGTFRGLHWQLQCSLEYS